LELFERLFLKLFGGDNYFIIYLWQALTKFLILKFKDITSLSLTTVTIELCKMLISALNYSKLKSKSTVENLLVQLNF